MIKRKIKVQSYLVVYSVVAEVKGTPESKIEAGGAYEQT